MAIAEDIIGTHYRYPDYFEVDREKIREFAHAVKDDHPAHFDEEAANEVGYDALVASLTFLAVAGRQVQLEIFEQVRRARSTWSGCCTATRSSPSTGPIVAGDKLFFDSYLDSVIESHGTVITEIRGEVTDADGKPVITSIVTIIGEAAHDDETDEVSAAIKERRDAAIAKMIAGQSSKD